tara:strand:- start:262 stop:513 length:252 start_codon:yes stop_codon:yes gene_type:complete
MQVTLNAETLAMVLTHRKIEKKYESLGKSPYKQRNEEFVGEILTDKAKEDYDKHFEWFMEAILITANKTNMIDTADKKEFKNV